MVARSMSEFCSRVADDQVRRSSDAIRSGARVRRRFRRSDGSYRERRWQWLRRRDEAGAGRDGQEPSFRKKYVDDVGEADSAFAAQHASRLVETENAVETAAVDQFAASVETGIAVAAAKTIGEQGTGRGSFENLRHLIVPGRLVNVLRARSSGNVPTRESA